MSNFGIFKGFSDKLFEGELPTNLGTIGSVAIPVALLDLYPNAAAAYSLRKLRDLYTGSAIRVRRSSDNTEQDIGFDILGNLNTSALTTFCGSGNGFVTTWYDQSNNGYNVTQSTAANQPQIVSSGSIVSTNGKPSLYFDASNDILQRTSPDSEMLSMSTHSSVFVHKVGSAWTNYYSVYQRRRSDSGSPTNYSPLGKSSNQIFYAWNGSSETYSSLYFQLNTQYINNYIGKTNGTLMNLYNANNLILNNTNTSIGSASITTNPILAIGNWTNELTEKYVQEIVIWAIDQTSNISSINTNVNTYYNVY